ncbi:MAG TPA: zf-HC2 domain-containing protein [Candidatus Acidoferrales bacterium]|nr:zf-HC2 domain-containing protein [Candidatus Acidoferrales bacterium]
MSRNLKACDEIRDLLSLAAAGALDRQSEDRVAQHTRECAACAAELDDWNLLARGLRRLPTPQPSAAIVERARARAEFALAEAAERRWDRGVLVSLIGLAWTITIVSWPVVRVLSGGLQAWLTLSLPTSWYAFAGLTAFGWVAGGVAAALLAWNQRRERRLA